jgi:hypothetical protein
MASLKFFVFISNDVKHIILPENNIQLYFDRQRHKKHKGAAPPAGA